MILRDEYKFKLYSSESHSELVNFPIRQMPLEFLFAHNLSCLRRTFPSSDNCFFVHFFQFNFAHLKNESLSGNREM
jgi:hypothetical protein